MTHYRPKIKETKYHIVHVQDKSLTNESLRTALVHLSIKMCPSSRVCLQLFALCTLLKPHFQSDNHETWSECLS